MRKLDRFWASFRKKRRCTRLMKLHIGSSSLMQGPVAVSNSCLNKAYNTRQQDESDSLGVVGCSVQQGRLTAEQGSMQIRAQTGKRIGLM